METMSAPKPTPSAHDFDLDDWFDRKRAVTALGGRGAVAERLGVSPVSVSRWCVPPDQENARSISPFHREALRRALDECRMEDVE